MYVQQCLTGGLVRLTQGQFINFLIYYPEGTMFFRPVDEAFIAISNVYNGDLHGGNGALCLIALVLLR